MSECNMRPFPFPCHVALHDVCPLTRSGSLDDPLMWGILPLRYTTDLANLRWGLGAHDICFQNRSVTPSHAHGADAAFSLT